MQWGGQIGPLSNNPQCLLGTANWTLLLLIQGHRAAMLNDNPPDFGQNQILRRPAWENRFLCSGRGSSWVIRVFRGHSRTR
jgi:hypothetical protein